VKAQKLDCDQCAHKDKSIFCQLEHESLNEVSRNKVMNVYKRGQVLFHQGNPAFGVYCVSSGKIKLTKISEAGRENVITIVGPGDLIGYQHGNGQNVNDVTATAIEDTKVCFIDRAFLQKMIHDKNSCAMELIGHLSRDMSEMQERMGQLQSKNVKERVEFLLDDLARRYGVRSGNGVRIGVQLSREEMASMIGVATETLIRELSILKDENVLAQDGKTLILLKSSTVAAIES